MRLFDWLFRTAMLALAGLVTLSMLASIAAISTEGGPDGWIGGGERPAAKSVAEPSPDEIRRTEVDAGAESGGAAGAAGSERAGRGPGPARWLEAIAYALLALAGLLAIALLLLASAARDLKRIADALSGRPS
jgi:hypothetical protein